MLDDQGKAAMEQRVKDMAPWPIGKSVRGAIRHGGESGVMPAERCAGVIWFYNDEPTPADGSKYMGWFSNPLVSKAMSTFGDIPPRPTPIREATFETLAASGERGWNLPWASVDITLWTSH